MPRYRQTNKLKPKCDNELLFKRKDNTLFGPCESLDYVNLGNSILSSFIDRPNFIGQINAETGEKVTFKEMKDKSVRLALGLQKLGITRDSVLTICTRNHMLAYVPLLAGIFLNVLVNMWDVKYLENPIRIIYFLLETNPDVIFVDKKNFLEIESTIAIIQPYRKEFSPKVIILDEQHEKYPTLYSISDNKSDDSTVNKFMCTSNKGTEAAILMYSSNASGFPGHVRIPYQAFQSPSNNQTPFMKYGDVGLWYGPINWSHNLLLTIRAILRDVTVIKSSTDYSEKNLCQIVQKYKVKWVFLESNMCNKLSNINNFEVFKKYDVSSLRTVLFGDAEIRKNIHENLILCLPNASIIKVYALSETGVIAYERSNIRYNTTSNNYNTSRIIINIKNIKSIKPIVSCTSSNSNSSISSINSNFNSSISNMSSNFNNSISSISSTSSNTSIKSSGYVSQNVQLMIVNLKTRKQVGENSAGEIWCKTPCIIQASSSAKHLASKDDEKRINEGWYYTEDIGYFDEYGNIYVIGNLRDVIEYRENVFLSLTKVEETLLLHPAVSEAAAAGMNVAGPDKNYPIAFVVLKPDAQVTSQELMDFAKDNLDDHYMLEELEFVEKIPYLPNGKVDRVRLLNMP